MDPFRVAILCKSPCLLVAVILLFNTTVSSAQEKSIDGKSFSVYRPGDFKPRHGLFYSIYVSPVYTVDPLGLGGKSTYALSLGTRINLWESRSPDLKGLKIKGWYVGGGYEYYPQQFDMIYLSAWLRVKTFMPLIGKIDRIYAYDGTHHGIMTRFCIGFEIRKVSLMLSGTTYDLRIGSEHPIYYSKYTTAGSVILIIPLYTHD